MQHTYKVKYEVHSNSKCLHKIITALKLTGLLQKLVQGNCMHACCIIYYTHEQGRRKDLKNEEAV